MTRAFTRTLRMWCVNYLWSCKELEHLWPMTKHTGAVTAVLASQLQPNFIKLHDVEPVCITNH